MKGEILYDFLQKVQEGAESFSDFMTAFMLSGRSSKEFHRQLNKLERKRILKKYFKSDSKNILLKETKKYRLLFYKLQRQGLIAKPNGAQAYSLTAAGKQKLETLTAAAQTNIPTIYPAAPSQDLMIVIFDIPESQRRKRKWLRSVLKNLGFTMVQKSVWKGYSQIPSGFLKDIQKQRLAQFIEIFKATKLGSLG